MSAVTDISTALGKLLLTLRLPANSLADANRFRPNDRSAAAAAHSAPIDPRLFVARPPRVKRDPRTLHTERHPARLCPCASPVMWEACHDSGWNSTLVHPIMVSRRKMLTNHLLMKG
jgi:hypothetical protein